MKILIVDDSRFFQNFLKKLFQQYLPEAQMTIANNGREAFEKFQSEKPDFVLSDLLMPELTGQELLRLIKENDITAKVIIISADIQKSTREEIKELGALAFFNKPLNNEKAGEIISLIKEAADA